MPKNGSVAVLSDGQCALFGGPLCFTATRNDHNAQCVLLGIKYTMKKTCFSCDASHFDESYLHHPVTMAENYDFLPRGVEGKAKKPFFCSAIFGLCPLWTNAQCVFVYT